jgi:hypothetical protein
VRRVPITTLRTALPAIHRRWYAVKGADMNIYEQLLTIRDRLEQNGAHEDSITLVEKFIGRAESERESATSVAQVQMIKHLLRQKEALDNDAIYNDLQELMDVYTSRQPSEDEVRPAYEDDERHPRPHSFYRQQKTKP